MDLRFRSGGAYYYHRFYSFQPDFDLSNPDVREEIRRIMHFWLQLGVSGFRVDAAGLMTQEKRPGVPLEDRHEFLRELRSYAAQYRSDVVLLGEADDEPTELVSYFGDGDEMDLLLNFLLDAYLMLALASERGQPLADCFELLPDPPDTGAWANFLRNYDELNIGRLPPEDRQLVFDRFAPSEGMRIHGRGIRRRLAPMLEGDPRRLKLAFSLLFSMPDVPLVVFGDEIGMGDDLSSPGREAVRTPMQWSAAENAGFSTAPKADLVRPIVTDGPFSYERVNVADQWATKGSVLNFMEHLIGTRHELPEIGWDDFVVLETEPEHVFAHRFDLDGASIGMVHNLSNDPCAVTVDLNITDGTVLELLGNGDVRHLQDDRYQTNLEGYGFR